MLGTHGVSLQNVFFAFSSASNSKPDLYGWNSIRSSLRFPSGEIKVAQANPIVSISRRLEMRLPHSIQRKRDGERDRGGKKKTLRNSLRWWE